MEKNNSKKTYLHICIGIIISLLLRFCVHPGAELTPIGVNLLSAFVFIVYLWITVGVTWTTVIVVPIIVLCGSMSVSEAISVGLGNSMTMFIMMTGMINVALLKTGCIEKFILWFITRNAVKHKPYMFIFFFAISIYLLSLVMAGATVCVIAIPIINGFCEKLGYTKDDRFAKVLYMLANWISLLGFVATPIGHSTSIMCISALEGFGYTVSFTDWVSVGMPISILWFALIMLTIRFFYNIDTEKYSNYDVNEKRKELINMGPLSNQAKITAIVFFLCVFLFFAPDILGSVLPKFTAIVKMLGNASIITLGVVILSILHVDGHPILDFIKAIPQIEWGPVFMNIAMYPISNALTADNSGIPAALQKIFEPIAKGMTSFIPFVILIALTMIVITQFMACRTIMVIGIMVSVPIAISMGINPIAIAMICCFTANMGLLTPPASGGAAVVFSAGYLVPKDGFILGWYVLPQGIIISLVSYLLANQVFIF